MRSLWLMMIALLLVGCGSSGPARPALNPVKGKVTLGNGTPLAFGTIGFEPAGGRAYRCSGKIGPDGTFELETSSEKGATAGKYKVSVNLPPNKKNSVPKKFQSDDTSGIEVEVVSGDNDLDIKLK
jgi:hypothetical protein